MDYTLSAQITADILDFQRKMDRVTNRMDAVGKKFDRIGRDLTTNVSLPMMALGGGILKVAGDFQASMNNVQALTQATGKEFQQLEGLAKQLGATTQYSASQSAEAMGFLAMAGFDTNKILGAMPSTLNLAAAAKMDMAQAADIVSNILTGMQMSVEELPYSVDVLAKAFTSANTDLSQLGEAMKYVGPVASGFGVGLEDTVAAIGAMSDAGIQASMAGTGLRMILSRLISEQDKLGIKTTDATGKLRPLADIISDLEAKGFTAAQALEIFGERGGPAMQTLMTKGSEAIRKMSADLQNAGGTADRIAKTQMKGFNGAMKTLVSALESVAIAIANSGLLEWVTGMVNNLASFIRNLSGTNKEILKWGTIIAGVVAAVGPLTFMAGKLVTAFSMMGGVVKAVGAALTMLTSPIGLVITAIAALSYVIYKNFDTIKPYIVDIVNYFIELYNRSATFRIIIQSVWAYLKSLFSYLKMYIKTIITGFKTIGQAVAALISGDLEGMKKVFVDGWEELKKGFTDFGEEAAGNYQEAMQKALNSEPVEFITEDDIDSATKKLTDFAQKYNPANLFKKFGAGGGSGGMAGPATSGATGPTTQSKAGGADWLTSSLPPIEEVNKRLGSYVQAVRVHRQKITEDMRAMGQMSSEFVIGMIDTMAQGLAAIATGTGGWGQLFGSILSGFGDFLIKMGKMGLMYSAFAKAIQKALLNPAVGLAASIALIAVGAAMKSLSGSFFSGGGSGGSSGGQMSSTPQVALATGGLVYGPTAAMVGDNPGAKSDPEVVAPLSKLRGYMGSGSQRIEVFGKIKGKDIIISSNKSQNRLNRIK